MTTRTSLRHAEDWLRVTRPVVAVRVALTASAAAMLAGAGLAATALAAAAGGCIAAGIYTLDDLFDAQADVYNHPERPFVRGRLPAATMWSVGVGLACLGALCAGVANPLAGLFALGFGLCAALEQRFNLLQRYWVSRGLALTGLVIGTVVLGALTVGHVSLRLWALALALGVPHFGGRILSDLPDVVGDRAQGMWTLPALNVDRSRRLVVCMLLLSAVTVPIPTWFGFGPVYLIGTLVISAYLVAFARSIARGSSRQLHRLLNTVMAGVMLIAVLDDFVGRLAGW